MSSSTRTVSPRIDAPSVALISGKNVGDSGRLSRTRQLEQLREEVRHGVVRARRSSRRCASALRPAVVASLLALAASSSVSSGIEFVTRNARRLASLVAREDAPRGHGRIGRAQLFAIEEVRRVEQAREPVLEATPEVTEHTGRRRRRDRRVRGDLGRREIAPPRAPSGTPQERARACVVGRARGRAADERGARRRVRQRLVREIERRRVELLGRRRRQRHARRADRREAVERRVRLERAVDRDARAQKIGDAVSILRDRAEAAQRRGRRLEDRRVGRARPEQAVRIATLGNDGRRDATIDDGLPPPPSDRRRRFLLR